MNNKASLAAPIAAAVISNAAFSQDSAPPASRASIKAETRAAEKVGKLIPAGETEGTKDERAEASLQHFTKTRAQRKAETRQALKSGELIPAGETEGTKDERAAASP